MASYYRRLFQWLPIRLLTRLFRRLPVRFPRRLITRLLKWLPDGFLLGFFTCFAPVAFKETSNHEEVMAKTSSSQQRLH
jgi:hypothetical protein